MTTTDTRPPPPTTRQHTDMLAGIASPRREARNAAVWATLQTVCVLVLAITAAAAWGTAVAAPAIAIAVLCACTAVGGWYNAAYYRALYRAAQQHSGGWR